MSRKSAEGTLPPTILEALEPRIAPAAIVVGTSNPGDGYSQAAFTKAANSPDPAIATLFAGSADHYYLTLDSKTPVKFGNEYADYITVTGSKALVFFYDKNSDGLVNMGEISGLSLGDSAALSINDNVGGDVLGTFNAKTGTFSATNLQPDAKSISKLAISGSVDGSIVAAGSISNVAGSFPKSGDPTPLKSAEQITTASDGTFSYNLGGTDVGQFTSTVVDPSGTQHIAYYDAVAGNLKYAKGSGSSWTYQTVDATGDVGKYTSIALTTSNTPVISYYDASNGDLKLATFTGVVWSTQTVPDPLAHDVGMYSSLVLKSDNPQIAYYDKTNGDLEFASYSGSAWSFTTIDPSAADVGSYASLAYDSTLDILHVSYQNTTVGSLKYGQSVAGGVWTTNTVDSPAGVTTGLYTSIAVDPSNSHVGISYMDSNTQSVHYAEGTSGGVFAPADLVVVQASVGTVSGQSTSLGFSATGPAISYGVNDGSQHLEFASRSGATWSHQTADAAAGSGGYASLAFNAAGTPFIAFYDSAHKTLDQVQLTTPPSTWSSSHMVDGIGVGTLAAFTPDAGKAGGAISGVSVGAVDKIVAGPGGAGAAGGSISNITVVSDTNGFEILGGAGGAGKTGGNGGAVTGVLVYGAVEASGSDYGTIKILGGDGASVAGAKAGSGGAVSNVYIGYEGTLAAPVASAMQLLNDKVIIGSGKGGTGAQGGAGGLLTNAKVSVATPDQAAPGDEIHIYAGAGGAGTTTDGIGGSIKTVLLENKNDKSGVTEIDDIRVAAGDAGDGAGGAGAAGGSVSDITVLGDNVVVLGGNGSAGPKKGGLGGSVTGVTIKNSDLDSIESLRMTSGTGGAATNGTAGNGGAISGVTALFTDFKGSSVLSSGDGGTAATGKGGNGGNVSAVKLFEPGQSPAAASLSVFAGDGGSGSAGGGNGGIVSQFTFIGFATTPVISAGAGGSATLLGKGGAGGQIVDVAMSAPSAAAPVSLTAGAGGNGAGKSGAGGVGGMVKHSNANSDPDVTFTAGNGGNAGVGGGKAGAGGVITDVSANSNIGSVSILSGSAGSGVVSSSAAAGGSVSKAVAIASNSVAIMAGNGAWGGAGGSITNVVWYGVTAGKGDQKAAPTGDIAILAGQGSANGKLAGAGGSIKDASGYASASVTNMTLIEAGDGNGGTAAAKSAVGGSVTNVSLFGGASQAAILAGDAGDLNVAGTGANGGSITGVNALSGVTVSVLSAGDGGSSDFAKGKGGLGGSVTKVNVSESIGSRGDTGLFTSTAVDTLGVQHVAFYDATSGDLKYFDGTTTVTVDSSGDVGQFASLKLTSADLPVISYYDASNGDLKLATYSAGVWTTQTVSAAGDVGQYSSLILTPADLPRVVFYDATGADLEFASQNAVGVWTTSTIDSTGDVGKYASLAYDATNGILHTSYFDASDTSLKYARSADGGIATAWKTVSVDDPDYDIPDNPQPGLVNTGYYTSIAVDQVTGGVGISYFNATTNSVCYAAGSSAGVFLTTGKSVVASNVGNGSEQGTTLGFDSFTDPITFAVTSFPVVAYQKFDSTTGAPSLQYAYATFSTNIYGQTLTTWTPATIDSAQGAGGYASMVVIAASGDTFISYHNSLSGSLETVSGSIGAWGSPTTEVIAPSNPFGIDNMGGIFAGAGGNAVSATGLFTSTVIDATSLQHISYYDPTHGDLKYAVGSGTTWTVSTVDSLGNVGQYTSIALTSTNLPVISYYDASNGDLKLATYTGAGWSVQTVNNPLAGDDVGQFTSLELKADKPQVSYYDATAGELEFASFDGTTWAMTVVDSGGVGKYDSLAYDPTGDIFHISYQDATSGTLKYARSAAGGAWTTSYLIPAEVGVTNGFNTSIAIDPLTHDVGISYINATGKALNYIQGTSAGVFTPAVVVKTGIGSGTGQSTSLAFSPAGNPKIACGVFDVNGTSALHVETRTAGVWADAAADSSAGSGQYASLAFDASGKAHVAGFNAGTRSLTEVHQPAAGGAWSAPATVEGTNGGLAGKSGNVTDITAKAITSIVAGRDVSPQLVNLVDKVYLRGLAAPTVNVDPVTKVSDGSFTTDTDPYATHPTVDFFASNLVGGIAGDPTLPNANQFKFVGTPPANAQDQAPPTPLNPNVYQWSLGVTQPLDGLVAALTLTTNKNFTPQAALKPVDAKSSWTVSPTGYTLVDYRNDFTYNS